MTTPIVQAHGLTKSYGGRVVVDDLSLECRRGTVLGLLGPNGAGKTTTLRMLYGFVRPDVGKILYDGRDFDSHRDESKRLIGVCTQEDSLDYDFTVEQNLFIYASYFRPKVKNLRDRVASLLTRFGLDMYAKASPHTLSGGYIRRLLIARSIVHEPSVLFLDEPTTGLDPNARLNVWELIDSMRSEGIAIILTTHYMDEAERLSNDLLVLQEGKELAAGTPNDVIDRVLGHHVVVVPPDAPRIEELQRWWSRNRNGQRPTKVLGELRLPVRRAEFTELSRQFPDTEWLVRPPNLDDLFIALARGQGGSP